LRYLNRNIFILLNGIFISLALNGVIGQNNLNLPTYYLSISSQDLTRLYDNPSSDNYYPAELIIEGSSYICEVRFRGTSARELPKKSWKVKFPNAKNIFESDKINFNSEYRDRSIMRNFLTNKLFEYLSEPAPKISFVNLFVNDEYYGVFSQIEELEEDFLNRNNLEISSIYKARSHSANFAPLPKYSRYFYSWDKQVGDVNNYNDLIELLNKLMFSSSAEFKTQIPKIIDLDNIINYFVVEFTIVGFDSFTKNYNLYLNQNSTKLFPWDNDATFGNRYTGTFTNSYISNIDGNQDQNWECLKFNVLFQRLMEYEEYRDLFNSRVQMIITNGFDHLNAVIDSTYNLISSDYHQDTKKGYTNQQFDDEKMQLKYFLNGRKNFLLNKFLFERPRIEKYFISNAFPKKNERLVLEIELSEPAEIYFDYVPEYDLVNGNTNFNVTSVQLYDDGSMQDKVGNDLIYSTSFNLPAYEKGIIPFAFRIGDSHYPANGFSYFGYGPTVTYALSIINSDIDLGNSLTITEFIKYFDDQLVVFKNEGALEIDLTYFHLKGKHVYDDFVFPPGVKLKPNNEIIVTNNKELANFIRPGLNTLEYLSFNIDTSDTLKIYSPANTFLYSKVIDKIIIPALDIRKVVINEINYHSSDSLDTGDWIEFYNPNDFTVFLGTYIFKDSNEENQYSFPKSAIIEPNSYFVLCQDVDLFKTIHPNQFAMGNFNFGLSNSGESVRLFDPNNILVTQVDYTDDYPWPSNTDGKGYTLELKDPNLENNHYLSWDSSEEMGGTPGKQNSNLLTSADYEDPTLKIKLYQNYPNPFNPTTTISYTVPIVQNSNYSSSKNVQLKVYDILGRKVKTLVNKKQNSGNYETIFEANSFPSGIFYYQLSIDNYSETKKMILLR
jgi:spore coat protein H